MNNIAKHERPNPRVTANPLSTLLLWWTRPIFQHGQKNTLQLEDMYKVRPADDSDSLGGTLEKHWNKELEAAHQANRDPKLFNAIRKTFMWPFIWIGGLIMLNVFIRTFQVYVLGIYISYFSLETTLTRSEAYGYATILIAMTVGNVFIIQHNTLNGFETGMQLRIAISSLIYRKMLKLSKTSLNKTTGGQIINLLSNDAARFDMVFVFANYIWIMPIQLMITAYLLWKSVHVAAIAGVVLLLIQTLPVQGYLGKMTSKLRKDTSIRTDERIRLMNEIVSGVQVIKMYAWEKPFQGLVSLARKSEVDVFLKNCYVRGINKATQMFTQRVTAFFTIMAHVLLGNRVSAEKVFTILQYFTRLQTTLTFMYPNAVTSIAEGKVAIQRMEDFLLLDENPSLSVSDSPDKKIAIQVEEVSASWDAESKIKALNNFSTTIKWGQLCAVLGPVGSGKSSFLQLLLGELEPSEGYLDIGGSVSYASQEPWLFTGNVRNNILFGQPYDEVRYRAVTRACALVKDFIQLPHGDRTLIGDRGALLSGGQRARINLARAVYRKADIYLFDDPLSAVDTQVGRELFTGCFKEFLAEKTVVLITHQLQYVRDVDWIIVVNNGTVEKQGRYEDFEQGDFKLVGIADANEHDDKTEKEEYNQISEISYPDGKEDKKDEPKETQELIAKGEVTKSLYKKYINAGGVINFSVFIALSVLAQLVTSGSDYWLAHWTTREELFLKDKLERNLMLLNDTKDSDSSLNHSTIMFNVSTIFNDNDRYYSNGVAFGIFGGLVAACVLFSILRNLVFFQICVTAGKNLHNAMFECLLKAPMRFFHQNSSGRILNRFSKDIGSVDELLPTTVIDALQVLSILFGVVCQVVIVEWWTVFLMVVISVCYVKFRNMYIAIAKDIKRLEGIAKSPVYSHVNASLAGLVTIRSAGNQKMLEAEFDNHQNNHTSTYSMFLATRTAFGIALDLVTLSFIAVITYSFVINKNETTLAGNVGLVMWQLLVLSVHFQQGMRHITEVIANMTAVERVMQYTELVEEGPFDSEINSKPPAGWPSQGRIVFDRVYLRYSDDDAPVLRDINLVIEPRMKVGIVGRTGAGKSSLISALFHLTDFDGTIQIDSLDTKKIGLHDLRMKISIIPQEPVLFSATLRDNLDPFHQFKDNELWTALEEVELKSHCQSLDHLVSQGGSNFSAGQRQLLCLARAIVRNNKVLVLDEATANVDPATDALIQRTIRRKFSDCTVLTIAHRLNTIMDSDKIIVMANGRIVEFDTPHILLQNDNGHLTRMVNETGSAMINRLKKAAEEAHNLVTQ